MKKTVNKNAAFPIIILLAVLSVLSGFFAVYEIYAFEKSELILNEKEELLNSLNKENENLLFKLNDLNSSNEALLNDNSDLKNENEELSGEIEKKKEEKKKQTEQAVKNAVIDQNVPKNKACYLTFDDGPSGNTLKILNILNTYNVKATFFVTGKGNSDYIKRIADAGHTVGLHTFTHNYSQVYSSDEAFFDDLYKIQNLVEQKAGIKSNLMRFPGGSSNTVSKITPGIMSRLVVSVTEKGFKYFDWNVSSGDASGNNIAKSKLVSNVLNGAKGKSSICVLMHDTDAKGTTVEALPEIIVGLANMGFYFEPLDAESYGYHHGINN